MDQKDILLKIQEILAEIIDDDTLCLTEETTPADVDEWNSLAHFQLVVALQNEYGIKFSITEIQSNYKQYSIKVSINSLCFIAI